MLFGVTLLNAKQKQSKAIKKKIPFFALLLLSNLKIETFSAKNEMYIHNLPFHLEEFVWFP